MELEEQTKGMSMICQEMISDLIQHAAAREAKLTCHPCRPDKSFPTLQ